MAGEKGGTITAAPSGVGKGAHGGPLGGAHVVYPHGPSMMASSVPQQVQWYARCTAPYLALLGSTGRLLYTK